VPPHVVVHLRRVPLRAERSPAWSSSSSSYSAVPSASPAPGTSEAVVASLVGSWCYTPLATERGHPHLSAAPSRRMASMPCAIAGACGRYGLGICESLVRADRSSIHEQANRCATVDRTG
jgi:hypothetical protein